VISRASAAFVIALTFVVPLRGAWPEANATVTVVQPLPGGIEPKRARILMTLGAKVLGVVPGALVPSGSNGGALAVGRLPGVDTAVGPLSQLVLIEGEGDAAASAGRQISSFDSEPIARMDTAALRARVNEQRIALFRAREAGKQGSGELAKLNAEVDELHRLETAIGGGEPPADVEAHRQRLRELEALVAAQQQAIKSLPQPPAFKQREKELTVQLNEEAAALRLAQPLEGGAEPAISPELQQKLDLIEQARGEHIDLLRRELAALRRQRGITE